MHQFCNVVVGNVDHDPLYGTLLQLFVGIRYFPLEFGCAQFICILLLQLQVVAYVAVKELVSSAGCRAFQLHWVVV